MERILHEGEVREYGENVVIFEEGSPADGFYVIMQGKAKIVHKGFEDAAENVEAAVVGVRG